MNSESLRLAVPLSAASADLNSGTSLHGVLCTVSQNFCVILNDCGETGLSTMFSRIEHCLAEGVIWVNVRSLFVGLWQV